METFTAAIGALFWIAGVESGETNGVDAPDAGAALGEFDVIKSLTKDGWGDTVMLVAEGPTDVSIVDIESSTF
jgi:hypothetical protein